MAITFYFLFLLLTEVFSRPQFEWSVRKGKRMGGYVYCPEGKLYPKPSDSSYEMWFYENCDHQSGLYCYDWNHENLACSFYTLPSYALPACKLHDLCYETGRSKNECDNEFEHNLLEVGMEDGALAIRLGLFYVGSTRSVKNC